MEDGDWLPRLELHAVNEKKVRKRIYLLQCHFTTTKNAIILPRQARGTHRETTQK
jgi:hypothetical protein